MKEEILQKVAEMTGISPDVCSKVINAFESVMGEKFNHTPETGTSVMDTITSALSGFLGKK